jgi:hypothetical protein
MTSGDCVFWLAAAVRAVGSNGHDYERLDTHVQAWVKAATKRAAVAVVKEQLTAEGWRLKQVFVADKVTPGFARLGSLLDPPLFSDDEADQWTENYRIAQVEGFSCWFAHYGKAKGTRR